MPAKNLSLLLADARHSGLFTLPVERESALRAALAGTSFRQFRVDLGHCTGSTAALLAIGRDLAFPEWYGANFDALNDCLTDPDWQPADGHLIFLHGLAKLRNDDPEGFATLIEVLLAAAEERRNAGHPFWLLIDVPARGVPVFSRA